MAPETYRYCHYEVDGPLLTLTIDRPEVLNAMHPDAHREFADAFDRYAADPSLRVAIVKGAGDRAFCVGTDLKYLFLPDRRATHVCIDRRDGAARARRIALHAGICLGGRSHRQSIADDGTRAQRPARLL